MFRIGHPVYGGKNVPFYCINPHIAVMALVSRGVETKEARKRVQECLDHPDSHNVMWTKNRMDVIEMSYWIGESNEYEG